MKKSFAMLALWLPGVQDAIREWRTTPTLPLEWSSEAEREAMWKLTTMESGDQGPRFCST